MNKVFKKNVLCYPGGLYKNIFRRNHSIPLPPPLQLSDVFFYKKARWALWDALKILKLKKDDTILFPSYHCGIEVSVILSAGIRVQFYRVNSNLEIDISDVRRLINSKTKALFIIHYFGLPHNMILLKKLCEEYKILLIEDCAQALYSQFRGKPVGSYGDVAIFSMRKTVPLPSGGALIVNNHKLLHPETAIGCIRFDLLKSIYLVIMRDLIRFWLFDYLRAFISNLSKSSNHSLKEGLSDCESSEIQFSPSSGNHGMSKFSLMLYKKTPHDFVINRRRKNFLSLLNVVNSCEKISPLVRTLPDDVCPPFFPVVPSEDPDNFLRFLRTHGVWADYLWSHFHPMFPVEKYPEAFWLKRHIIILPVHHELSSKELNLIQRSLFDWEKSTSR